jgi:hypothetical protein
VRDNSCEVAVKALQLYLYGRTPTTGVLDEGANTCSHMNSRHTEHSGILGFDAVLLGLWLLTFQRILVSSSSKGQKVKEDFLLWYTTLRMKTLQTVEMPGTNNPANTFPHPRCTECSTTVRSETLSLVNVSWEGKNICVIMTVTITLTCHFY